MDADFWTDVSYVERAGNRERVLRAVVDAGRPMTPAELADDLDIVIKSASRAVRGLADRDLVACRNPDAPRDRRYEASDRGRRVLSALDSIADRAPPRAAPALAESSPVYAADRPDDVQTAITYVRRAAARRRVLARLAAVDVPLTPSELADDLDLSFNSASRAVRQLADHDLAQCLTPEADRYRRYTLTDRGQQVVEAMR